MHGAVTPLLIYVFTAWCSLAAQGQLYLYLCLLPLLGYGLDNRGSRVRFPEEAGNSSLHHRVQAGSGTHPASYPMGTGGSFPGGKAAGA
jgi:hypothetical protein